MVGKQKLAQKIIQEAIYMGILCTLCKWYYAPQHMYPIMYPVLVHRKAEVSGDHDVIYMFSLSLSLSLSPLSLYHSFTHTHIHTHTRAHTHMCTHIHTHKPTCQTWPLNYHNIPRFSTCLVSSGSSGLWSLVNTLAMTACCPGLPALGLHSAKTAVESPTLATKMWFCRKMIVDAVVPAVLRSPILLVFQDARECKVFDMSQSLRGVEEWNVLTEQTVRVVSNAVNQVLSA